MKLVEIVQVGSDLGCAFSHDVGPSTNAGRALRRDLADIHRQKRDFLAHIVVELAGDARALDFLGCDTAGPRAGESLPGSPAGHAR